MNPNERLAILRVTPSQLAPRALVVGDRDRAFQAAQLLSDPDEIGHNREYRTFTGTYAGTPLTICSHGIGGPAASVCFQELFQGGVQTIIRAGTCGALVETIEDGQLVLATGAIREDGTSTSLVPLAYPAIADRHVIQALEESATDLGYTPLHTGIALTQAYLYPGDLLPITTDLWMKAGAVCVEMELATLLVMAGLQGVRAGGIFTSDGNLARIEAPDLDTSSYDPHRDIVTRGMQTMLTIALEALTRFP
jgi:uridine phosphorylase